ncbi:hypothetical protein BH10ACT6_BH10ACT6_03820 [soil metagenome]
MKQRPTMVDQLLMPSHIDRVLRGVAVTRPVVLDPDLELSPGEIGMHESAGRDGDRSRDIRLPRTDACKQKPKVSLRSRSDAFTRISERGAESPDAAGRTRETKAVSEIRSIEGGRAVRTRSDQKVCSRSQIGGAQDGRQRHPCLDATDYPETVQLVDRPPGRPAHAHCSVIARCAAGARRGEMDLRGSFETHRQRHPAQTGRGRTDERRLLGERRLQGAASRRQVGSRGGGSSHA